MVLAQTAPDAATLFYITVLFIFVSTLVVTIATKWTRDKCLRFFHGYRITVERTRGQTTWGTAKVFPTGIEIVYEHAFTDNRGHEKTSNLYYSADLDAQLLSLFRYHDEMPTEMQAKRVKQVRRSFNPGPMRRLMRRGRNLLNTFRDALSAIIGAAMSQYQRMNPAAAIATQGSAMTTIGTTLVSRLANAFEPLLEQYIGQPVILDVADPLNPNNATVEYAGYLADYTQQYIAVFNVEHDEEADTTVTLPDVDGGEALPPLPPPPGVGAPPPVLPVPMAIQNDVAIRVDGKRFRLQNLRHHPIVVRRLRRNGFEPLTFRMIIPPRGWLDLPVRDARGATLDIAFVRTLDVIAPRRLATVRHAGRLIERTGLVEELKVDRLPLIRSMVGEET